MAITDRVARLRQYSLDAVPTLSSERAALMTAFYQTQPDAVSIPVQRAATVEAWRWPPGFSQPGRSRSPFWSGSKRCRMYWPRWAGQA